MGCEASVLPKNKLTTVQASQASLRALDHQTASTVLRGWMRRNPHRVARKALISRPACAKPRSPGEEVILTFLETLAGLGC